MAEHQHDEQPIFYLESDQLAFKGKLMRIGQGHYFDVVCSVE